MKESQTHSIVLKVGPFDAHLSGEHTRTTHGSKSPMDAELLMHLSTFPCHIDANGDQHDKDLGN
jgi:hypothetical protein